MVKNVYILGGGVTGLAVAYELLKRGQSVEIIEKSKRLCIQTKLYWNCVCASDLRISFDRVSSKNRNKQM